MTDPVSMTVSSSSLPTARGGLRRRSPTPGARRPSCRGSSGVARPRFVLLEILRVVRFDLPLRLPRSSPSRGGSSGCAARPRAAAPRPSCSRVRGARACDAAPDLIPDHRRGQRPPRRADRRAAVSFAWVLARDVRTVTMGRHEGVKVSRCHGRRLPSPALVPPHPFRGRAADRASIAAVKRAVSAAICPVPAVRSIGTRSKVIRWPPSGRRADEHGDHRRTRAQRQHRGARRRVRGAAEERHEHAGAAGVLVDENRDDVILATAPRAPGRGSRARRAGGSACRVPAEAADERVEAIVVHAARDHRDRIAARGDGGGEQLPVAGVAGHGERPPAVGERRVEHLEVAAARTPGSRAMVGQSAELGERSARRGRRSRAPAARAPPRRARGRRAGDAGARDAAASPGRRVRFGRASDRPPAPQAPATSRCPAPPARCCGRAPRCAGRGSRDAPASRASAGAAAKPTRPRHHTTPARRRSCRWMTPAGRRVPSEDEAAT